MKDKDYLQLAIAQAKKSVEQGGFPAGAIVVLNDEIIARGVSLGSVLYDPTSHSELVAIREACLKTRTTDLSGATLFAAMQPCNMCFSAANWAGISRIVFGCSKTAEMVAKNYYEGSVDIAEINERNSRKIELVYVRDFENEVFELIRKWEQKEV